jgi:hypothetical protein
MTKSLIVGAYTILDTIGAGGTSRVFKAELMLALVG